MEELAMTRVWPIKEAGEHLEELIAAAADGEQVLTRDGEKVAVVLSAYQFELLKRLAQSTKPTFAEVLLAIPHAPDSEEEDIFKREPLKVRDVDFGK
jgi:prevent-host-death family protein